MNGSDGEDVFSENGNAFVILSGRVTPVPIPNTEVKY
jgi:hypothetical protein